jgi:hypothetical protein
MYQVEGVSCWRSLELKVCQVDGVSYRRGLKGKGCQAEEVLCRLKRQVSIVWCADSEWAYGVQGACILYVGCRVLCGCRT